MSPPTELEGLLFDVDYLTRSGKAWIRLFVRTSERMEQLLDPSFEPYFYAAPEDDAADLAALSDRLTRIQAPGARIVRCEPVERLDGFSPARMLRVVVGHPQDVPKLRELVARAPGVAGVREADILFANRYLLDKSLVPMEGIRARVEPGPSPGTLSLRRAEPIELADPPELSRLAFDLEVHNPRIVPDPQTDPIVIASVATSGGRVEILQKEEPGEKGDRRLLERFAALVLEEDPDVLLTYNGDNFDWPYLMARAKRHGLALPIGRDGSEPDLRQAGPNKVVTVAGRANVDLLRVAQRDLQDVKVKTLANVAEHMGVLDRDDRTTIPKERIGEYWDDPNKRRTLLAYARDDVTSTLGLGEALLPMQYELCRVIRMPLDETCKMGRGRQVDWYLLSEAAKRGMVAPQKTIAGEIQEYEGGLVLEPPRGLLLDVVALDFSSMYPSIMLSYNVSPDTFTTDPLPDDRVNVAPGVGHRFLREPDGFFKQILSDLVSRRKALKAEIRTLSKDSPLQTLLDVRQKTVKVLTNSVYGYLGWPGARWYRRECAEATSAWGRHFIQEVQTEAQRAGISVLYGDTDSLFVRNHPGIDAFVSGINDRLPLELDLQDRYRVIFFTGAKKRYAGLTTENEIVVRGLEVRRGDWCELAKRLQEEILEKLLRNRDPKQALEAARSAVRTLREGSVPVSQLTIHKTLTQNPEDYKAKQAHVLAVERARRDTPDYRPTIGSKIAYVMVRERGSGTKASKQSERAKIVDFLKPEDELDLEYYVDKQLVPAALRVLEHFGYAVQDLKGEAKQQSLKDWF